jgi:hypothetical protein
MLLPILVIDNNELPIYKIGRYIWRKNVDKYKDKIKLIFLRSTANLGCGQCVLEDDCFYVGCTDQSNIEIIKKTLLCINYCLDNYNFDTILRTNLSSFYAINNLIKLLEILPRTNLYAGYKGFFDNNHELISFCSGSGFLISRDICSHLLNRSDQQIATELLDDVWFGKALKDVPRLELPRKDFCKYDSINIDLLRDINEMKNNGALDNQIQFRVKSNNASQRINVDSFILNYLYNHFN